MKLLKGVCRRNFNLTTDNRIIYILQSYAETEHLCLVHPFATSSLKRSAGFNVGILY